MHEGGVHVAQTVDVAHEHDMGAASHRLAAHAWAHTPFNSTPAGALQPQVPTLEQGCERLGDVDAAAHLRLAAHA
jgi:hypothetical protein